MRKRHDFECPSINIKKQLTIHDDMGGRWRYGIISTVMVGVMVSYLQLWLALWYHIYSYGWRYGIISTDMVGVMVSYLRLWLALWYHIYGYGWRYGIISTVMVSYLRLWLALWYHIYGYGWRYGIISTVMVGVMVSYLRLWLALWYHIYGYGWRYGIISTVPYEQQKIYRQIILFQRIYYLSISLMSMVPATNVAPTLYLSWMEPLLGRHESCTIPEVVFSRSVRCVTSRGPEGV